MQVAKAVSHSLNNCVNCLPGQKDVDVALKSIGESSKKLLVDSVRGLGLGRGLGEWSSLRGEWGLLSSGGPLRASLSCRRLLFLPTCLFLVWLSAQ